MFIRFPSGLELTVFSPADDDGEDALSADDDGEDALSAEDEEAGRLCGLEVGHVGTILYIHVMIANLSQRSGVSRRVSSHNNAPPSRATLSHDILIPNHFTNQQLFERSTVHQRSEQ